MRIVQLTKNNGTEIVFQGTPFECKDFLEKKYLSLETDSNLGGMWGNGEHNKLTIFQRSSMFSVAEYAILNPLVDK